MAMPKPAKSNFFYFDEMIKCCFVESELNGLLKLGINISERTYVTLITGLSFEVLCNAGTS